jgi:enoyl-CoA hydratase
LSGMECVVDESGIARITFTRTERKNAIDLETHGELERAWLDLDRDPAVRAVVLTGRGPAFSAGGDASEFDAFRDESVRREAISGARRLFSVMHHFSRPVIAAVRGPAVGLGCTIALLADVVVAGDTAFFSDPHLRAGLAPGDGGALLWAPSIGHAKARYLLLTGKRITATEAERMGLIAEVVPDSELEERSTELATELAAIPSDAFELTKRLLNLGITRAAAGGMEFGLAAEELTMRTRGLG